MDRTLHVHDKATGELVDIVAVSPAGLVDYETGAGRDAVEAITRECAARGIPTGGRILAEALAKWTDNETRWSAAPTAS